MASELGITSAAPKPVSARPAMRIIVSGAKPHATVPRMMIAVPTANTRRRP